MSSPRPVRAAPAIAFSLLIMFTVCARAQVVISEFMAANSNTVITDEEGSHADWLELQNNGASSVNLNGWYLTDKSSDRRKWRFPVTTPAVNLASGARLLIWCSGKDRKADATHLHTNFSLDKSAGGYLALVRADGITIEHSYASYPAQPDDVAYGIGGTTQWQALVGPAPGAASYSLGIKVRVPSSAAEMSDGWNNAIYNDALVPWYARTIGLETTSTYPNLSYRGVGFDTSSEHNYLVHSSGSLRYIPGITPNTAWMSTVQAVVQVRAAFTVADASQVKDLQLKMQWEDGFVAYLNGTKIAERNAPATPAYTSTATADRLDGGCEDFETITLSNAQAYLVNGTNVLAILGLNDNASNQIFICTPALDGRLTTAMSGGTIGYLQAPTPGGENAITTSAVGPIISKTTKQPEQPASGFGVPPLVITTTVKPSMNPVATVQLFYRTMFGAESSVTMTDNGGGNFAGSISFILSPGQMLRWRVEATDSAGAKSYDPPYTATTDNDRYYGTVAENSALSTSQLSVLHWFVDPAIDGNSRSKVGARSSFFFRTQKADGSWENNFYDNVDVRIHGQSSSGFPVNKKSHNISFNRDNRFKWKDGEDRVKGLNLITDYADKAKVRHTLAYETFTAAQTPAHFAVKLRVQKNAGFWGTYDLIEDAHEQYLARVGLDPNGALYKCYNYLDNASQSVNDGSGVEKKTREFEDSSDLANFEAGLNPANSLVSRRTYLYDHANVPALINLLAVQTLILGNDFGHKNYYIYCDSLGTGEWWVLPWDEDLSFGHTWASGPSYFDDDIDSQAGLQLGATGSNRLMQLVYQTPELAQMYVRRLRTLMDQFLISASETNGPLEQRINQKLDAMDPPGATYQTDADLDLQTWGYWTDGSGTAISGAGQDAATHDHGMRRQALRILNSNPNPPYPSSSSYATLGNRSTIPAFLPGRRARLYGDTSGVAGQLIPTAQPAAPLLFILQVDYNPGNGEQEYFTIKNTSGTAIDLSGWKVAGAIDFTFQGGTVIPPFTSGSENIGLLHVARNPKQFRARTGGVTGGQLRFITGPYKGRLSARGGTIELRKPDGTLVLSNTFTGTPTAAQNFLRVTELNFSPKKPTTAESAALPGVDAGSFEFIEFTNTGTSALSLGGAQFDEGVTFVFPTPYTLAAGARCLVISNLAAFHLRYGMGLDSLIVGVFEGSLDNSGEELRILDPAGEEVLRFTYQPSWYSLADAGGYSLVTRTSAPVYDSYNAATTWALSENSGGSPGGGDTSFSQIFDGWKHDHFSAAEEGNSQISALSADPDGDGENNWAEYVFGRDPRTNQGHYTPTLSTVNVGGVDYLAITFDRRKNARDVSYTVQVTGVLGAGNWVPVDLPVGSAQDLGNGMERVSYRDNQPASASPRFIRVQAL